MFFKNIGHNVVICRWLHSQKGGKVDKADKGDKDKKPEKPQKQTT